MKTNFECTNYFLGIDGKGTCDTGCQWWKDGCPCAKGHSAWDGKAHYSQRSLEETAAYPKHFKKEESKK